MFNRFLGIEPDRFGQIHQLQQADALLTGFDLGDVGPRAVEPFGEIDLAQAGLLTAFDQEYAQRLVTARDSDRAGARFWIEVYELILRAAEP